MRFIRTANAGGILEAEGCRILLDGVCAPLNGYEGTPPALLAQLLDTELDLIAFTHGHPDHFHAPFVRDYLRRRPGTAVLGPADVALALSPLPVSEGAFALHGLRLRAVPTRHIGAAARRAPHVSFILQSGGTCLWFTGDAAPVQNPPLPPLPRPDILLAPYAYAATEAGWQAAAATGAGTVVLLHLPRPEEDPAALRQAVDAVRQRHQYPALLIPGMGEALSL